MSIDLTQHYPINDVILNLQTYCSKDEAVGILLGLISGPLSFMPIDNDYEDQAYRDPEREEFKYIYSLQDDLEQKRIPLENDYTQARIDNLSETDLTEKMDAIKSFDTNYIHKARQYLCHIDDELSKGSESKLRVLQDTCNSKNIKITLKSLDEWATKGYKLSIFNSVKSNTVSTKSIHDSQQESDSKGRLGALAAKSLYITLALFIEEFAALKKSQFMLPSGKINALKIAKYLDGKYLIKGQGEESIQDRIAKAILIKNEKLREED
jgi:hypothetical protein